jgi:nitrous oxidase accessory protein NosD
VAIAAAGLAAGLALLPSVAGANTIDVRDNQPNAIQAAIDGADDGDRLLIHRGRYGENVFVTKRLHLIGAGGRRPVINGRCDSQFTVAVRHAGVKLRHLKVVGADSGFGPEPAEVDFRFVPSGRAEDLVVRDTCGGEEGAEYGINVFQGGQIDLVENRAVGGFTDGAIYVGDIEDTGNGALRILRNVSKRSSRGIIIEFSENGVIRARGNNVHHNNIAGEKFPGIGDKIGILNYDSDRVWLLDNRIRDNPQTGVFITPGADGTVLRRNRIVDNGTDIENQGTNSCGSNNVFDTIVGNPLPAC